MLKRIAIGLAALLAMLIGLVLVAHLVSSWRLAKAPPIPTTPFVAATDSALIARGDHIANVVSGCSGCHAPDYRGTAFSDEAPIGYIPAPNLTTGIGGIGSTFTDAQWERAIRHGIGSAGQPLFIMPSTAFAPLSDSDLSALIAYLRQLPPVDNDLGPRRIQFPGTVILGLLAYPSIPVNTIDHATVGTGSPAQAVSAEYGEYLSQIGGCGECHGANLAGGTDASAPIGTNLTPGGEMSVWTEGDFITAIRIGQTPGRLLSDTMPWKQYRLMTDDELKALYLYLHTLPPLDVNPVE